MRGCRSLILFLLIFIFLSYIARGQYQVYTWENFEDGNISPRMQRFHNANENNCAIVNYNALRKNPVYETIMDGIARTECGNYGILITILPEECKKNPNGVFVSLVSNLALDRASLYPNGRAIIQMDVFLPREMNNLPTIAVLAVGGEDPSATSKWFFYRLGILNLNQNIFISCQNLLKSKTPFLYKSEKMEAYNLKLPGWHRLQILFEGKENIYCYIDGKKTGFSPQKEPTLAKFRMGMTCTESSCSNPRLCILDNLSIQYCMEGDATLPESPWTRTEDKNVVMNPLSDVSYGADPLDGPLRWFLTPQDAVEYNRRKNAPYLVYFHSPSVALSQECNAILDNDAAARDFLRQFVCIRNDINQLGGGTLANQLGVFKVPAFVLLDNQGNKKGIVLYYHASGWNAVAQKLQEFLMK
jgi:hypothetical protein